MFKTLQEAALALHPQAVVTVQYAGHCTTYRIVLGYRVLFAVHDAGWPVRVEQQHVDPTHSTTWAYCHDDHDPNGEPTHWPRTVMIDGEEMEVLAPVRRQPINSAEQLRTLLQSLSQSPETQDLVRLMAGEIEAAQAQSPAPEQEAQHGGGQ